MALDRERNKEEYRRNVILFKYAEFPRHNVEKLAEEI